MQGKDTNVRAVERALRILDCFTQEKSDLSLLELSREINLSPSTTTRLLGTLESSGYLYRDPDNLRYYLGFKLARLSGMSFSNLDVIKIARPFLRKLVDIFNESVGIYMLKGDQRICIDRMEGTQTLRSVVQIGDTHTLTRGASGKVLLAYLPKDRILEIISHDPFTNLDELAEVRQHGYKISHGERDTGVVSVAAPIFNASGEVLNALFLTIPSTRSHPEFLDRVVSEVQSSAREISRLLGSSI